MEKILSKGKHVFVIFSLEKIYRLLFVTSIVGIILSAHFFDDTCLVTSSSSKEHVDYVSNYQCGSDDGIGIGVAKFLFFVALILTALTTKVNCFAIALYILILLLQIFFLMSTHFAGMVSYRHTI